MGENICKPLLTVVPSNVKRSHAVEITNVQRHCHQLTSTSRTVEEDARRHLCFCLFCFLRQSLSLVLADYELRDLPASALPVRGALSCLATL